MTRPKYAIYKYKTMSTSRTSRRRGNHCDGTAIAGRPALYPAINPPIYQ
jgi:hypothetical protein